MKARKFLSFRDKNGFHRRSKSADSQERVMERPSSADHMWSMFKDPARQPRESVEEPGKTHHHLRGPLGLRIDHVRHRLEAKNIHGLSDDTIEYVLVSAYCRGNMDKAIDMLQLQHKSFTGIVTPYNPNIAMLGAENRYNVTCYLDALLFAMFAKLDAFEVMLKNSLEDENQRQLAALIRLWVNMLRTGKLIRVDMAQRLQEALSACGWKDAQELEQQDTSEAFAFITETLQLPLLTLQVDLFHQGKGDADDHKVVYERLLNLAVPPDPEGKGIKLEDCLEDYFNTQVDVLRDSLEEKKAWERSIPISRPTVSSQATLTLMTTSEEESSEQSEQRDTVPLERRWTTQTPTLDSPISISSASDARPPPRHRSTSLIQRIVLDEEGRPTDSNQVSLPRRMSRKGSTVVKAVTIPAWQFYKLIPWHTTSNSEPQNDVDVARQFNQRPVVGICLKRYMMTADGTPKRQNTYIDIPDSLRLPQFMLVDDMRADEEIGLSQEFKLVLQSVVCHRGDSLHMGHYVAFSRVNPKLLTDNRRHDLDPPPDYEEAQWVKFDDLETQSRVSHVDDIRQALKEEMPYLLFYQIVPMVEVTATSVDGTEAGPPSYNDSAVNVVEPLTPTESNPLSRSTSDCFDLGQAQSNVRFSSDLERPPRISIDGETLAASNEQPSRRQSLALSGVSGTSTSALTPETGPSPAITPSEETSTEAATDSMAAASRFSRAASRFTKSKDRSRPASQSGEGRISLTISRLGLSLGSKDSLREEAIEDGLEVPTKGAEEKSGALIEPAGQSDQQQHAHHQKKGKAKERIRVKQSTPPDRECVVM